MDIHKILSADLLDILFEGKNKEYGAYQLRKTYNRHLRLAMLGTLSVVLLFGGGYAISKMRGEGKKAAMVVEDVQLEAVHEEKRPDPPVPPPPKVEPPKVEMIRFTPPKIVKDKEVKEDEKPPEQDKLTDTRIDIVNQEGIKDDGIMGPPLAQGNGVVEGPKKEGEDYDRIFNKVEIESQYPGGTSAWLRYMNRNFHYPDEAIANEIQGLVVVQFIVDKEGVVSDVQAISGPEEGGLREEAVRVIQKSGKWQPAIQNGRQVKSYKKQPIVFKLQTE